MTAVTLIKGGLNSIGFMKHKKSIEIVEEYSPPTTVHWKEMADQANAAHPLNEGEKES